MKHLRFAVTCTTARFDAVDVVSGCRTRLRESRLAPDGRLVLVGGGRTFVRLATLGITLAMFFFPEWCGPTSPSLNPSTPRCSLVCCARYFTVFVPATPNDGILTQLPVLHLGLLTSTIPSKAAVHSTPLFSYLQLQKTNVCRSLRFCTFCS